MIRSAQFSISFALLGVGCLMACGSEEGTGGTAAEDEASGSGGVNAVMDGPVDDDAAGGGTSSSTGGAESGGSASGGASTGGAGTIDCRVASDCVDLPDDTECAHRSCNEGKCELVFEEEGTPLTMQTPGDCKRLECGIAGEIVEVNEDADVPNDGNDCTTDSCVGGPKNDNVSAGESCSAGVCDGKGNCTGCVEAADCGEAGDCRQYECNSGTCEIAYLEDGTPLPDEKQVAGDCRERVCGIMGATREQADDEDPLADDPTDCVTPTCSAGSNSSEDVDVRTACGDGSQLCDGEGSCQDCVSALDCPAAEEICRVAACSEGSCSIELQVTGDAADEYQTAQDCKVIRCSTEGVPMELSSSDPFDDNNSCTDDVCSGMTPSHNNRTPGTPCSGGFCSPSGNCESCYSDGHCPTNEVCHSGSYTCVECQFDSDCGRTNSTGSCSDAACGVASCSGDFFNTDNEWVNGCESRISSVANSFASPRSLTSTSCNDGEGETVSSGSILFIRADSASHPGLTATQYGNGASRLHYRVFASGGICVNDYEFTATQHTGTPGCYSFTVNADVDKTCVIGDTGSCTVSSGSGSYDDDEYVYFEIKKTCATELHESASFSFIGHL